MGLNLLREKKRIYLLSFFYRLNKLFFFFSAKKKLKFFLDLEWIFDRLAFEEAQKVYTALEQPSKIFSVNFIKKKVTGNTSVCDIGCEYGDLSYSIACIAKDVTSIDCDKNAIDIAKKIYNRSNLNFVWSDAFSYLNSMDKKFNVLILSHVLEHIEDPESFLNKAKNHFEFIYIEVPDFDKNYLNHYRLHMGNDLIYSDNDHVNEFDRMEIKSLLSKCSLRILDEEYRFGVQKIWCTVS